MTSSRIAVGALGVFLGLAGVIPAALAWSPNLTWNRSAPIGTEVDHKAMRLAGPGNVKAAFDGKPETAWCVEAPGVIPKRPLQTIAITFDRPRRITGIYLLPSHAASLDTAKRHPRPSELMIATDEGGVTAKVDDTYERAMSPTPPRHVGTPPLEALRRDEMVQIGFTTATYGEKVNGRTDLTLSPVLTSKLEIAVYQVHPYGPQTPVCISEIRVIELEEPKR